MSETKSKDSYQKQNLIVVGQHYVLKTCIYRGKKHNWYLGNPYIFILLYLQPLIKFNQVTTSLSDWQFHLPDRQTQTLTVYKRKKNYLKIPNIPTLQLSGDIRLQNTNYYYQVFDRYGPSLKLCFQFVNYEFTLPTICMIAIQILNILEKLHNQSIVHCNLRPKKILTQLGKNDLVLIDFQHSTKYKHKNGKFIGYASKFSNLNKLTKYSSLNQHLGLTASPKDDLESLGFILMYFLKKGDLFKVKENGSKIKKMEEQKLRMIPEKYCKDMPIEILQYFQFIRMTNVQQYPLGDYEFLKKLFRNLLQQLNINEKDFQYDWVIIQIIYYFQIKKMNLQQSSQQQFQQLQKDSNNQNTNQTKIIIHQPQNLEGIQEVQTELERSSIKREFYRQISSLCISDEEDKQFESVSTKMLQLPNMFDLIKLKS
ncbi:unnamed protein product [Paramecium primaurelia]|uniref:Casein kinase I n=1 Tax=Paramecium primaurelia TaxID=5886 RepID=A0A8S1PYX7_PARPR|nr:unnamed protein product [Paramecium primaurelia]